MIGKTNLLKEEMQELLNEKTAEILVERVSGRILETFNLVLGELRKANEAYDRVEAAFSTHNQRLAELETQFLFLKEKVEMQNLEREELRVLESRILSVLENELSGE